MTYLPPIERDEELNRTYYPLPGGWEIRTIGGIGSSFLVWDTKTGEHHLIPGHSILHDFLERMVIEVRQAHSARIEYLVELVEELMEDE